MCDKNPQKVKALFNEIAQYYDKINNYISFFTHYIIKYLALKELNIKPRSMILDVCCGTGDFTQIINKFYPRVNIIGIDFSHNIKKKKKIKNPNGVFAVADCLNLPFKEREFNYVTASFGLRNIENRKQAIAEIYRVLDFGGEFLHVDFGEHNKLSKIFDFIVPIIAKISKINIQHYKYLIDTKNDFPQPDKLIEEFSELGFKFVKRKDYLFGAISIQIMEK